MTVKPEQACAGSHDVRDLCLIDVYYIHMILKTLLAHSSKLWSAFGLANSLCWCFEGLSPNITQHHAQLTLPSRHAARLRLGVLGEPTHHSLSLLWFRRRLSFRSRTTLKRLDPEPQHEESCLKEESASPPSLRCIKPLKFGSSLLPQDNLAHLNTNIREKTLGVYSHFSSLAYSWHSSCTVSIRSTSVYFLDNYVSGPEPHSSCPHPHFGGITLSKLFRMRSRYLPSQTKPPHPVEKCSHFTGGEKRGPNALKQSRILGWIPSDKCREIHGPILNTLKIRY